MMKITIEINANSAEDLDTINAGLKPIAFGLSGQGVAVESKKAPAKAAIPVQDKEPEEAPTKTAEKPKKAPPKKAPAKADLEDTDLTIKDVRAAFSKLVDALGAQKGHLEAKKLLKSFDAKQIPDLDTGNYGNVIESIDKLIENNVTEDTESGDDDLDLGEDDEE